MVLSTIKIDQEMIEMLKEASEQSKFGLGMWACRILMDLAKTEDDAVCCICMDEIVSDSYTTMCKHTFHKTCLLQVAL